MEKTKTSIDPSIYVSKRTAIDSSGRIGSLYDAYRDRILGRLNVKDDQRLYQSHKKAQCEIMRNHNYQIENIFQFLDIDEQLILSILLELAPKTGIASITDYPYETSKYTRVFCYSYVDQIQQVPDKIEDARAFIKSLEPNTDATHIFTRIEWGIDFVVLLELPHNSKTTTTIDRVLDKIRTFLYNDYSISTLSLEEKNLLESITSTKVYSQTCDLYHIKTLYDVCRYIEQNKYSNVYHPISYTLRPIRWLYPYYTGQSTTFKSLPSNISKDIESYVVKLKYDIKKLETTIYDELPKLLCGHLNAQLADLQKQWSLLKINFTNEMERLSKLVMDVRKALLLIPRIDQAVKQNKQSIKQSIDDLDLAVNDLQEKGQLIKKLTKYRFQYVNVADCNIDRIDNEITMERKLLFDEQHDCILCSNDTLNESEGKQLRNFRQDMINELDDNPNLRLIYADFSYCTFELRRIMKLPSNRYIHKKKKLEQTKITSSRELQNIGSFTNTPLINEKQTFDTTKTNLHSTGPFVPNIQSSPLTTELLEDNQMLNILLLGETGVGKSTFINAFANYLKFNTLQQAETGHPIVLIPVSFLITVGDNFDERTVKFGDINESKNENFDHPGQSVTQRCQSYIFNLNQSDGKKLCIIDTPGFGDTRGIDQDDLNMQHILKYIKNRPPVNAICFLLKPNESRLNIFFRSCFNQLLSFFGGNIGNHIIFCFTNSRSTLYAPGNTAPLLKNMLSSLPKNDIPFTKNNTFCFDSESFRYLVARRNKIQFTALEKKEYETSWIKSVTDAKRLIHYIHTNRYY